MGRFSSLTVPILSHQKEGYVYDNMKDGSTDEHGQIDYHTLVDYKDGEPAQVSSYTFNNGEMKFGLMSFLTDALVRKMPLGEVAVNIQRDKNGNVTRVTNGRKGHDENIMVVEHSDLSYVYEFDHHHNWTKCTDFDTDSHTQMTIVERVFTYYE